MSSISTGVVRPALLASTSPLAGDLLARLRQEAPARATATRPYSRRAALQLYQRKAAKGDPPSVRTEGYPALLAALLDAPVGQVIVHGLTFADVVYLVFTDPDRQHCLGVLRKWRLTRDI